MFVAPFVKHAHARTTRACGHTHTEEQAAEKAARKAPGAAASQRQLKKRAKTLPFPSTNPANKRKPPSVPGMLEEGQVGEGVFFGGGLLDGGDARMTHQGLNHALKRLLPAVEVVASCPLCLHVPGMCPECALGVPSLSLACTHAHARTRAHACAWCARVHACACCTCEHVTRGDPETLDPKTLD